MPTPKAILFCLALPSSEDACVLLVAVGVAEDGADETTEENVVDVDDSEAALEVYSYHIVRTTVSEGRILRKDSRYMS